jgi:hypothetical protein
MTDPFDPASLPSVPFTERKSLPAVTGVYFVLAADGSVAYIGKARSIRGRWQIHHREYHVSKMEGASIAWLELPSEEVALAVERQMIDRFRPPLNNPKRPAYRGNAPKQAGKTVNLMVRMSPDIWEGVLAAAESEGRSTNSMIIVMLQDMVDKRDRTDAPR